MPATPTTPKPGGDEREQLIAATLAVHQREGHGLSYGSPDSCSCGAKTYPEHGDDDVSDRRYRAFAIHQAAMLAALTLPAPEAVQVSREQLRNPIGKALTNAMNYPPAVRPRILGRDLSGLIDSVIDVLLASALFALPVEVEQVKALDPWPWRDEWGWHKERKSDGGRVRQFAPRANFSQNSDDYPWVDPETGGE